LERGYGGPTLDQTDPPASRIEEGFNSSDTSCSRCSAGERVDAGDSGDERPDEFPVPELALDDLKQTEADDKPTATGSGPGRTAP